MRESATRYSPPGRVACQKWVGTSVSVVLLLDPLLVFCPVWAKAPVTRTHRSGRMNFIAGVTLPPAKRFGQFSMWRLRAARNRDDVPRADFVNPALIPWLPWAALHFINPPCSPRLSATVFPRFR